MDRLLRERPLPEIFSRSKSADQIPDRSFNPLHGRDLQMKFHAQYPSICFSFLRNSWAELACQREGNCPLHDNKFWSLRDISIFILFQIQKNSILLKSAIILWFVFGLLENSIFVSIIFYTYTRVNRKQRNVGNVGENDGDWNASISVLTHYWQSKLINALFF